MTILIGSVWIGRSHDARAEDRAVGSRETQSFDDDWRFHLGDPSDAERPQFDDSAWRTLDVPHDWSIEGEFNKDHPTGGAGGFLPAGIGWYRKQFALPQAAAGRKVVIQFDGVMANSDVWINGEHLGNRPNGYVSFCYDLTPYLRFGSDRPNVLAVRVDNSQQPASRWYTGAGIYRHMWLMITDQLHIRPWGVFVSTPEIASDRAVVRVITELANRSDSSRDFELETTLVAPDGEVVATVSSQEHIAANSDLTVEHNLLSVDQPQLWDIDKPELHSAITCVRSEVGTVDNVQTPFGIRHAEFRSDTGFWLNGRNLKLKGVCLHHDGGAFGAAVPMALWERRLEKLKAIGVNAIRTAHNPPDPDLLDLCDRLGVLVMDELFDCWTVGKTRYDYHRFFEEWSHFDARDTIRRDRNHPSVILYSVGNEIRDTPKEQLAKQILSRLVAVCHENDPTRPVTQGLFRPNVSHDYDNGLADMLDVIGTNYRDQELLAAWRQDPSRMIIGTEQSHERSTWLACRDHPQHAGQFLWVGVDYLGESRRWPVTTFNGGLLDRAGTPRPRACERASWWSDEPMVHIVRRVAPTEPTPTDPGYEVVEWRRRQVLFSDWTPTDREAHVENLEVYSNCDEVELFLNGRSLGSRPRPADASSRKWKVEFSPGSLKAVGSNSGQIVAEHEVRTAGEASSLALSTDCEVLAPGWDDVAFVELKVVDAEGVRVPDAAHEVAFAIEGPGRIVAVDNGSIVSHEPFLASRRRAFQGRCLAAVKATGESGSIVLTAKASGLDPGSVVIQAMAQ